VDLQIAIHGNVYTNTDSSSVSFVYSEGVDVVAVIPSVSPLSGGFAMSAFGVYGSVGANYKCALSGVLVQGTINRFGEVECITPAGVEGFAAVGIRQHHRRPDWSNEHRVRSVSGHHFPCTHSTAPQLVAR